MSCCPIALAIRELEPNKHVDVMPCHAYIGFGDGTRVCDLPEIATDFVVNFDMGYAVSPIEFDTECRPMFQEGQEGR
jgi:hypothetical protein